MLHLFLQFIKIKTEEVIFFHFYLALTLLISEIESLNVTP